MFLNPSNGVNAAAVRAHFLGLLKEKEASQGVWALKAYYGCGSYYNVSHSMKCEGIFRGCNLKVEIFFSVSVKKEIGPREENAEKKEKDLL